MRRVSSEGGGCERSESEGDNVGQVRTETRKEDKKEQRRWLMSLSSVYEWMKS